MSANTSIEWTDHTFNPWWGCTRVSVGCANCYAETFAHRFGVEWGKGTARRPASEKLWAAPRRWNDAAKRAGKRAKVFCSSMADVFDPEAPADALSRLFDLIRFTPWLDWQLLTKRPENIRAALPADWGTGYRNVWLGVSVENQAAAEARIPKLLEIPARVRFLSCEPLLGRLDLQKVRTSSCPNRRIGGCQIEPRSGHRIVQDSEEGGIWVECACSRLGGIDWIIAGGESGPSARPMHPDWARSLRDQCQAAGVPFLFKQWGEYASVSEVEGPGAHHHFPDGATVRKVGKKAAGRRLDGREWNEFPNPGPQALTPKES